MNKVNTSAVVIIPPREKWKPIQEIRLKYDRTVNRWMPHITLLYPFRPIESYPQLENKFLEVCSQINSFRLSLKKFKTFSHGHQNYTIWLDPEPKEPVIFLQDKILKLVPDCNDVNKYNKGFTPHLSVGQIKGKEKLLKILTGLQSSWIQSEFLVNNIFFITREKNKDAKFEIKNQIPLSN